MILSQQMIMPIFQKLMKKLDKSSKKKLRVQMLNYLKRNLQLNKGIIIQLTLQF